MANAVLQLIINFRSGISQTEGNFMDAFKATTA
jgi:hypothetical protein